jgi:predicted enzyme related to lactoylglutathione lyase
MTHDVERAKKFYAETVGWRFEPMPMPTGGTYWIAKMGEQAVGGFFPMNGPEFAGVPEHWVPYVEVDNVDARVKGAVAAGAEACRSPFDIPDVGRIAILREPGGAMVAWMTPLAA